MRTVPEYRDHTGPPGFAEKPVCTETPLCEGCPFPSHGFLCQGGDGECMRTRVMKLSDREEKANEYAISQSIRKNYPPGTRVMLNNMDDPYSPVESGTRGTVRYVDDCGQLGVAWDNGRSLSLVPGVDSYRRLTQREIAQEQGMEEMKL